MVAKRYDNMSVMRKCTLIGEPFVSNKTNGVPYILGFDTNGAQYNILLTYLPPNVTLSQLQQGQQWWIERRTTEWTLLYSVGEFNPYNYALFNSTVGWTPSGSPLTYTKIVYDALATQTKSTMGGVVVDPTTGLVSVPVPGLYDVVASASLSSGDKLNKQIGFQVAQKNNPTIYINGHWSSASTGTTSSDAIPIAQISTILALTETYPSFSINVAWGGTATPTIDVTKTSSTYLIVAYRGPIT